MAVDSAVPDRYCDRTRYSLVKYSRVCDNATAKGGVEMTKSLILGVALTTLLAACSQTLIESRNISTFTDPNGSELGGGRCNIRHLLSSPATGKSDRRIR